jgi:hypothetical protein
VIIRIFNKLKVVKQFAPRFIQLISAIVLQSIIVENTVGNC